MFNNLTNHDPILDITSNLLGQGDFLVIVLARDWRKIDIDARALAGKDVGAKAVLAEVDLRAVDLIEQHSGQRAEHLQGETRTLDNVDRGHEVVDDEVCAGAVVDADGVCFAHKTDGGLVAARDED